MFNKILHIVGERLVAQGECPTNSDCPYSGSSGCIARGDALEEQMTEIEAELHQETAGLIYRDTDNPSPWPCENIVSLSITFVDPDD